MWTIIHWYAWVVMLPAVATVILSPIGELWEAFSDWRSDRRWQRHLAEDRERREVAKMWEERERRLEEHLGTGEP